MTDEPQPERISDTDLERHQGMLARYQQAQQLQGRVAQLISAVQIWAEELHERYDLDASRGEGVLDDGTIVRSATMNP